MKKPKDQQQLNRASRARMNALHETGRSIVSGLRPGQEVRDADLPGIGHVIRPINSMALVRWRFPSGIERELLRPGWKIVTEVGDE